MRKLFSLAIFFSVMASIVTSIVSGQQSGFINVDGPSINAKMEAALRQARSGSAQKPFWTAYSFDVRPGVAVDLDYSNFKGTTYSSGTSVSIGTRDGKSVETRNLGVFVLREPESGKVTRVEIYNLDRPREYSGHAVYWAGRASVQESLDLLKGIAESGERGSAAENATMAIGLHDSPLVSPMLKDLVRNSKVRKVRSSAVFWLGQSTDDIPFLAEFAKSEDEDAEVRKQAVFSIGVSKSGASFSTLQDLYAAVKNREVKKQVIFISSLGESKEDGVNFLIKVADSEPDLHLRKDAIFWLGQKAGERSLKALSDTVNRNDAETEVLKQAVFAISQRSKDESVPLLIQIAKTHANPVIRKDAMFWLGQSGDERAVAFFKEILLK
ncbi:MAG TPA: HEAT repeat domain-containing protein [Blastocatellia bacterium]|nr:HEAT repeat domain-containing protein [Blastocatellia bacterium]